MLISRYNYLYLFIIQKIIFCTQAQQQLVGIKEVCQSESQFEEKYDEQQNYNYKNIFDYIRKKRNRKSSQQNLILNNSLIQLKLYSSQDKKLKQDYPTVNDGIRDRLTKLKLMQKSNNFQKMLQCVYFQSMDDIVQDVIVLKQTQKYNMKQLQEKFRYETTPQQRINIYIQIARALEELHSMQYVYSDLKPENVTFIDQDFDFLLMNDSEYIVQKKQLIRGGDFRYVPLARCEKDQQATTGTDVFSLAFFIINMEIGIPDFEVKNRKNIIQYYDEQKQRFKSQNKLNIQDDSIFFIFKRMWYWLKRILGIKVTKNMNDLIEQMTVPCAKDRISLNQFCNTVDNWKFKEEKYRRPTKTNSKKFEKSQDNQTVQSKGTII